MRKISIYLLLCLMPFGLAGCKVAEEEITANQHTLYSLNHEASKLVARNYALVATDTNGQIEEIYQNIAQEQDSEAQATLLPDDVTLQSWKLNDKTLVLNFNANYGSMESTREVLVRAGMVRSFDGIADIANIVFAVEEQELLDGRGQPVGPMRADDFVEDSGKDVNAYNYVTLKLYFANRTGDRLVLEERKIYYSKNTPIERVVVEQLSEGPKNAEHYPVIPAETKILGASAMDGLGYVNLDQAFLNHTLPVKGEVTLQSIVQSIIAACDVGKVQISINGESKIEYRDNISLDQFFEIDNSLLEVQK